MFDSSTIPRDPRTPKIRLGTRSVSRNLPLAAGAAEEQVISKAATAIPRKISGSGPESTQVISNYDLYIYIHDLCYI